MRGRLCGGLDQKETTEGGLFRRRFCASAFPHFSAISSAGWHNVPDDRALSYTELGVERGQSVSTREHSSGETILSDIPPEPTSVDEQRSDRRQGRLEQSGRRLSKRSGDP